MYFDNISLSKNAKPVINSTSFSVDENSLEIGLLDVSDADGHALTYSTTSDEITINSSGLLAFNTAPNYEIKSNYSVSISVSDGFETSTKTITVFINDLDEGTTNTATECDVYISNAKTDEFRYCWQESQDNSGEEYSANVNQPISITFDGAAINIPQISYVGQPR